MRASYFKHTALLAILMLVMGLGGIVSNSSAQAHVASNVESLEPEEVEPPEPITEAPELTLEEPIAPIVESEPVSEHPLESLPVVEPISEAEFPESEFSPLVEPEPAEVKETSTPKLPRTIFGKALPPESKPVLLSNHVSIKNGHALVHLKCSGSSNCIIKVSLMLGHTVSHAVFKLEKGSSKTASIPLGKAAKAQISAKHPHIVLVSKDGKKTAHEIIIKQ